MKIKVEVVEEVEAENVKVVAGAIMEIMKIMIY